MEQLSAAYSRYCLAVLILFFLRHLEIRSDLVDVVEEDHEGHILIFYASTTGSSALNKEDFQHPAVILIPGLLRFSIK